MKLASFRTVALLVFAAIGASATAAQHPRVLKRQGIVYGVRGIGFQSTCKGMGVFDECNMYTFSGTIASVERDSRTGGISTFVLRTTRGRTKTQNIEGDLPAAAEKLLRLGHRVRVSGIMTGQMQVAFPNKILIERAH